MPNFRIGSQIPLNDASRMPALGIGTWQLRGRACEDAVFHAIEKGYRMVDTASAYRNEAQVGKAIGKAINELGLERNDIFVITKICNDEHDDPRRALKGSLQRLGLDHVNLYLIHWPVSRSIDTWETMGEFVQEGLASSIGVSNFTITHLETLSKNSRVVPAVNQVEFSPFLYQKELLDYCRGKMIQLVSYSPLMRGHNLGNKTLTAIAKKHNKTPAQIVLRWNIDLGIIPIPKSKDFERIDENADIFDFELTGKEVKRLGELSNGTRYCQDPELMMWEQ